MGNIYLQGWETQHGKTRTPDWKLKVPSEIKKKPTYHDLNKAVEIEVVVCVCGNDFNNSKPGKRDCGTQKVSFINLSGHRQVFSPLGAHNVSEILV